MKLPLTDSQFAALEVACRTPSLDDASEQLERARTLLQKLASGGQQVLGERLRHLQELSRTTMEGSRAEERLEVMELALTLADELKATLRELEDGVSLAGRVRDVLEERDCVEPVQYSTAN